LGSTASITQERIPSWNISGRPKKPKRGTIGFNIRTHNLEYWSGTEWFKLPMKKIKT